MESFAKMFIESLMTINHAVNELPNVKDDYSDSRYDACREVMNITSQRILHLIENILHYLGIGSNFTCSEMGMDADDQFHILSDVNSELAERIGILLDEVLGIKKDDASLVVVSRTPKQLTPGLKLSKSMTMRTDAQGSSFTLITGKNIPKPQLLFREKIDNSNQPFFPKIKQKPNAQLSLEESLNIGFPHNYENDSGFSFPHPYQYELVHFVPGKQFLDKVVPEVPSSINETPLVMIDDIEGLVRLNSSLKKVREIAVDLEHHSFRSFLGFTCLMQISTRKEDYIVDTLLLRDDLHILNDIFTQPEILKVFHGSNSDIEWLQKDFGIYVVNMFDSGQAARTLGFSRFSLAYLLKYYCGIETNKKYQTADWRLRPLPAEMLKYAREDTHYLLYIYDCMKNDLLHKDNGQSSLLLSVFFSSTQLCLKKYEKPQCTEITHEEFYHCEQHKRHEREMGFISSKKFNNQQMDALKSLYAWRDGVARHQDESTSYVLPNHMLLQICEILPKEPSGIIAVCVPLPPMVQSHIDDIHRLILKSRQIPLVEVEKYQEQGNSTRLQNYIYKNSQFLDSPHDLSHRTDTTVDFQDMTTIDSQMQFGLNEVGAITEKPKSDIFMFGNTCLFLKSKKAIKDLNEVFSAFTDYFDKFLPLDLLSTKYLAPCCVPSLNEKILWNLLPDSSLHSFDVGHSKVNSSDSPETFPKKSQDASHLHEKIYSIKKRTSTDKEQSSLLKQESSAKRANPFTRDDFKPYVYENIAIAKFLDETKVMRNDHVDVRKKIKDYDSPLEYPNFDLKTNPQPKPVCGSKTMMYSSKSSNPQIRWPRK